MGNDEIKIFHSWVHKKAQIEKLISGKEIKENFEKIGYEKTDYSKPFKINGTEIWEHYKECFIFEEYVCL